MTYAPDNQQSPIDAAGRIAGGANLERIGQGLAGDILTLERRIDRRDRRDLFLTGVGNMLADFFTAGPVLAVIFVLFGATASCSVIDSQLGQLSPAIGSDAVRLTAAAQKACQQQEAFNTLAAGAVLLGPQAAAIGAAASAAVGVGCIWANS